MAGNAAASQTPRHVNGDGRGNFKDAHAADRRKHFLTILRFPLPQASAGVKAHTDQKRFQPFSARQAVETVRCCRLSGHRGEAALWEQTLGWKTLTPQRRFPTCRMANFQSARRTTFCVPYWRRARRTEFGDTANCKSALKPPLRSRRLLRDETANSDRLPVGERNAVVLSNYCLLNNNKWLVSNPTLA